MTEENKTHKAFIAQERKLRKENNRGERAAIAKAQSQVDAEINRKKMMDVVEKFSQNRKLRRQFRKQSGMSLPPVNLPYRKDMIILEHVTKSEDIVV